MFVACALHDAQNAFKWAMGSSTPDADVLRNIPISVESLRNSTDLLQKHLALWVNNVLRFAPAGIERHPLRPQRGSRNTEDGVQGRHLGMTSARRAV